MEFMERFQRMENESMRMKRPTKDSRRLKTQVTQPSQQHSEDDVRKADLAFQQLLQEEEAEVKQKKGRKKKGKSQEDDEAAAACLDPAEHAAGDGLRASKQAEQTFLSRFNLSLSSAAVSDVASSPVTAAASAAESVRVSEAAAGASKAGASIAAAHYKA
jgi:hypothetical protein